VILAAGSGERIGGNKALLLDRRGATFLGRLASTFGSAGYDVIAVVGSDRSRVCEAHPRIAVAPNPGWRRGQLSSARVGLRAALMRNPEIVALHPVDLPLVRALVIRRLTRCLTTSGSGFDGAVPRDRGNGARGHPLLLVPGAARKLLRMRRLASLREGLTRLAILDVDCHAEPGCFRDVDDRRGYLAAIGHWPRWAPP
jgi:CTP:molybdopterin cytidylyltransferase MocA